MPRRRRYGSSMHRRPATLATATLLAASPLTAAAEDHTSYTPTGNSVIFVHPDGGSAATWTAARALWVGPDSDLHWDRLPHVAVYKGHLANSLTASSNGGATAHAAGLIPAGVGTPSGTKPRLPGYDAFGRSEGQVPKADLSDDQGRRLLLGQAAVDAGLPVGLVQTGVASEPGTAVFVVDHEIRWDHEGIADKLIHSGAQVLFSGGERYFRPADAEGVHGPGAREDGRDLVAEAESLGYTVIFTRDELLWLPDGTQKVLGLFSHDATFNAVPDETLVEMGKELFEPDAPTVAEMTGAALRLLGRDASGQPRPFFLVVEEEGSDNFGNNNNAAGTLESLRRADLAIGVAESFVVNRPDTLLITAADSDGGGLRMVGLPTGPLRGEAPATLEPTARNGAPQDGPDGTGSAPFLAAPDAQGRRMPFAVVWSHLDDVSGGVVVRAADAVGV